MKLEIINPNKIVESAHYVETKYSFSLFINTIERWVDPDVEGSDEESIEFYYHPDDPDYEKDPDIVRIIFETDKEKEIIGRLRFKLHSKEQLWVLFPIEQVYDFDDDF